MRTIEIDGKEVIVIAERNDEDGGIVSNTLVPAGDGSYYNFRTWTGRGILSTDVGRKAEDVEAEKLAAQDEALATFQAMSDAEIADRAAKAVEPGVSGKTERTVVGG